ncbi:MAG TPA: PEP-CTERM sorting domain-containing protein [Methylomirabilota bacterium]|jgi:hypothetical protein|nr:PEP-CTERM sorting domain-containing protein [Methylomirabilota bacterium]
MKHTNWWVAALALAGGLALADSAQAQGTTVVSDFHNFNLSVTYANWDPNAWSFSAPVITSGPLSYRVVAQGYGSGAYNLPTPLNVPGATQVRLTFTLNTTTPTVFLGPNFDLSDGTHQVQYLNYANYTGPGTYELTAPIGTLDTTDITAFNLEFDPAGYGNAAPYDITFNSLVLLSPVPEPASFALLALGATGFVIARRRAKAS